MSVQYIYKTISFLPQYFCIQ